MEEALSTSYGKIKRNIEENEVVYDVKSDLGAVNMKNWREIDKMAPFGLANPKPIFLFENVKVENIKKIRQKWFQGTFRNYFFRCKQK